MGRYALVASYYNIRTKRYENEIEIKVNGYDFSKLQDIDRFTLGNSKSNMWNIVRNDNDISGRNFFSIRYIKNSSSAPIYYMVLHDDKKLLSCVNDLALGYGSQRKYTYSIKNSNAFFQSEKGRLIDLIEKRDYEMIDVLLGKRGHLRFLIDRYLNSYYDSGEQEKKIQDMAEIILEFSRYKTFRGWIVSNKKFLENRVNINNRNHENRNNQNNRGNQNNGFKYKKLDEKDFVVDKREFLREYNKDNEEFLDEEELDEMMVIPTEDDNKEMFGDVGKASLKRRR